MYSDVRSDHKEVPPRNGKTLVILYVAVTGHPSDPSECPHEAAEIPRSSNFRERQSLFRYFERKLLVHFDHQPKRRPVIKTSFG
jgi:hypothetical protein